MTEKQLDTKKTPIEELQCSKKYVYDTGIIFECKNNCKSEIIGEDVVDLLNELATKCSQLEKENEQLKSTKKKRLDRLQNQREQLQKQQEAIIGYKGDIKQLRKENEQLKSDLEYWKQMASLYNNQLEINEHKCIQDKHIGWKRG